MIDLYDDVHEWLVQEIVLPLFYQLGWMNFSEESVLVVDWVLFGVLQIIVIAFILRPLEKKEIAHLASHRMDHVNWSGVHQAHIRTDIFYSFLHRLGIYQFFFFYTFSGFFFWLGSHLHDIGFDHWNVEELIPGVTSIPFVSFCIYLVLFDLLDYVYHRLSHRFTWWWQLHALHHSQQHLSVWSDDRNHLIDSLMRSMVFAIFALWIGVEPSQFLLLVLFSQLVQSWQHGFYPNDLGVLNYLIVTPQFHRYHHAMGLGYELPGRPGVLGGCNFGVLFPWWDIVLGTAVFKTEYYPSGVQDFDPPSSFIAQQWLCLKRSWNVLKNFNEARAR